MMYVILTKISKPQKFPTTVLVTLANCNDYVTWKELTFQLLVYWELRLTGKQHDLTGSEASSLLNISVFKLKALNFTIKHEHICLLVQFSRDSLENRLQWYPG